MYITPEPTPAELISRQLYKEAFGELSRMFGEERDLALLAIFDLPIEDLFAKEDITGNPAFLPQIQQIFTFFKPQLERLGYSKDVVPVRTPTGCTELFPDNRFNMGMADVLPLVERREFNRLIEETSILGGALRAAHRNLAKLAERARQTKLQGKTEAADNPNFRAAAPFVRLPTNESVPS